MATMRTKLITTNYPICFSCDIDFGIKVETDASHMTFKNIE